MREIKEVLDYLKEKNLILTTAESCTGGRVIHLLAKIPGSGECLDAGLVVYSKEAKKRLLNVKQSTIDNYTLTSEEVAAEMVQGALKYSIADVVVATTGIAGPGAKDGIPEGTVCFAWGFNSHQKVILFSETQQFSGSRSKILTCAATYALIQIPILHRLIQDKK
jgi:nicotinamide-nucleotide amidase